MHNIDYHEFVRLLYEKTADSMGNPTAMYPVVQEYQNLFQDELLEYYTSWLIENQLASNAAYNSSFCQNTLAFALLIQQIPFGSIEIYMELSIAACEFLLKRTPEDEAAPLVIFIKNILGLAYLKRKRGDQAKNIENTIDYLSEFLDAPYFRDNILQRAAAYSNLGEAYINRIYGEKDNNLKEALTAIKQSLQVFDKENYPKAWAISQMNLGCALITQSVVTMECVTEAVQYFQNALSVYNASDTPLEWAMGQKNLAEAFLLYYNLFENKVEKLDLSIAAFQNCLKVYNQKYFTELWIEIQVKLAVANKQKHILCKESSILDNINQHCLQVLMLNEPDILPSVSSTILDLMDYVIYHQKEEIDTELEINAENIYLIRQMFAAPTWREVQTIVERNSLGLLSEKNFLFMDKLIRITENGKEKNFLHDLLIVLRRCPQIGINNAFEEKIISVCLDSPERIRKQPDFDKMNIDSIKAIELLTLLVGKEEDELSKLWIMYPEYSKILTDNNAFTALLRQYPDLAVFIDCAPEQYEIINEQEKIMVPEQFAYILQVEAKFRSDFSDSAIRVLIKDYNEILGNPIIHDYPMFKAYLLYNISECYFKLQSGDRIDHLNKAVGFLKSAVKLIDNKDFPVRYGYALCLLAELYGAMKADIYENTAKAVFYYQKAALFITQSTAPRCFAAMMTDMGELHLRLSGDENKTIAINYFFKALHIYTKEAAPLKYASVKCKIGKAYLMRDTVCKEDIEAAIQCFNECLLFYTKALPFEHSNIYYYLGMSYTILSGLEPIYYQTAELNFDKALFYLTRDEAPLKYLEIIVEKGNMYFQKQDWTASYKAFEEALNISEDLFRSAYMPDSRLSTISTNVYIYNKLILLCWKRRDNTDYLRHALEFAEAAKARTFMEQIAHQDIPAPMEIPAPIANKEQALIKELQRLERIRLYENTPKRIGALSKEIFDIHNELTELWRHMEKEYPSAEEYLSYRKTSPLTWENYSEIINKLDAETAIVSFYFCDQNLFTFVLKKGMAEPYCLFTDGSEIKEFLGNLRCFKDATNRQKRMYRHYHEWLSLGENLLEPLDNILEGIKFVYFIPHDIFHSVPLHALKYQGKYFIEKYYVAYVPSIAILDKLLAKKSIPLRKNHALIMAYEPSAAQSFLKEAKMVEDLFESTAYLNNEATIECLTQKALEADLIHISCHGEYCEDAFQSNLLLAHDQKFTVKDWMNLNLNADLITLSACQTGLNKECKGDEMEGLSRALFYAGAHSALLTLWTVDSEKTMLWMQEFYSSLLECSEKPNAKLIAFRNATIKLIHMDDNPYIWAPFILMGGKSLEVFG